MVSKRYLSPKEVEELFGIKTGTLAQWRSHKKGPKYYRMGERRVAYLISDVEEWIQRGLVLTSECPEIDAQLSQ